MSTFKAQTPLFTEHTASVITTACHSCVGK